MPSQRQGTASQTQADPAAAEQWRANAVRYRVTSALSASSEQHSGISAKGVADAAVAPRLGALEVRARQSRRLSSWRPRERPYGTGRAETLRRRCPSACAQPASAARSSDGQHLDSGRDMACSSPDRLRTLAVDRAVGASRAPARPRIARLLAGQLNSPALPWPSAPGAGPGVARAARRHRARPAPRCTFGQGTLLFVDELHSACNKGQPGRAAAARGGGHPDLLVGATTEGQAALNRALLRACACIALARPRPGTRWWRWSNARAWPSRRSARTCAHPEAEHAQRCAAGVGSGRRTATLAGCSSPRGR